MLKQNVISPDIESEPLHETYSKAAENVSSPTTAPPGICFVCRKLTKTSDLATKLEDVTPSGSFTYQQRLSSIIDTSKQQNKTDRICCDCAQLVDKLEALQLSIVRIENELFDRFTEKAFDSTDADRATQKSGNSELTIKEQKKVQHRRRNRKTAQLEEPRQKKAKVEKKVKKAKEEQKCDQCDNVFSTRKLLAKHQFSVHSVLIPLPCDICDEEFATILLLKEHEKSQHQTHIVCNICGKSVIKYFIQKHTENHLGQEGTVCDICHKVFFDEGNLKTHMKSHSSDKEFKCQLCSRAFKWSSSLRTHIQAAHNSAVFKCLTCDREFKDKYNLRKHEYTHGLPKPYSCSTCEKGFIRRDLHSRHVEQCTAN